MMNGQADHALCAFAMWELEVEVQRLRGVNMALQQEVARLKEGGEKLRAVPQPPEEKADA